MGLEYQKPLGHEDDDDIEMWVLYPNMGEGCAHGTTDRGFLTAQGPLLPRGYDRTINMMDLGDQIMPSFSSNFSLRPTAADPSHIFPPSWLVAWQTTTGIPVVIWGQYDKARRYGSAATTETEAITDGRAFGSATFHDDGAGTALLYAGSMLKTDGTAGLLNKRTQAAVWSQDADVTAKYIVSAAGAMWRSTSDYQVSKCPAGSDPFTIGSWGGAFQVGTSDSKITGLAQINGSPVVLKEDAIYFFSETANDGDGAFLPEYKASQKHPFNFNWWCDDGAGGFYTGTNAGDVINVQKFGAIVVINSLHENNPGRDSTTGRIGGMCVDGADLYAVVEPSYRWTKNDGIGIRFLVTTDNGGSYTGSNDLVDNDLETPGTPALTIDTEANGDWILFGASVPFLALQITLADTNATASVMTVQYSTGAGTWSDTAVIFDATAISDSSPVTLARNGTIAVRPGDAAALMSEWTTATYNSLTRYWWKITVSVALDSTSITEMAILPARAAPTWTTPGNAKDYGIAEMSGLCTKILRGKRDGDSIIWHDIYTLPFATSDEYNQFRPPGGTKIAVSAVPTQNSPNASLWVVGRDGFAQFALPTINSPAHTGYPVLERDAGSNHGIPCFYPSTVMTNGEREFVALQVYGKNISEQVDSICASVRPDDTHPWYTFDKILESFAEFTARGEDIRGKRWSVAVQLIDGASTDAVGPGIEAIVLWLRKVTGRRSLQPSRATPEVS